MRAEVWVRGVVAGMVSASLQKPEECGRIAALVLEMSFFR